MATNNSINSVLSNNVENQYFYEDEVFRFDKKGRIKFGLVMENYEASTSDIEDEFVDILGKGEIRVAWHPDGKEEILDEKIVGLADRTLMPGDVVRRMIPGKDTQRGYCRDIFVKADVKIVGTKLVIRNISADRFKPLITMPRDNAVCLDSWVGSTKTVHEKLVLISSCGSILELRPDTEYCPLKDTETKSRNGFFAGTLFYPGQVLVGPVSALDSAKWIKTSNEMRTSRKHKTVDRKFVVQTVEIEGVWVHWQCKALSNDTDLEMTKDGTIQQPKCYITGDDLKKLKRLNLFESCMLQINDKNYLTIDTNDNIIKKSQWKKEQSNKYIILLHSQYKRDDALKTTNKNNLDNKTNKLTDKKKFLTTDCDINNANFKKEIAEKTNKHCPKSLNNCCSNNALDVHNNEKRNCDLSNDTSVDRQLLNAKHFDSDCWQTEEDTEDSMSDSGTTISSCSSNTPKSSPKRSPLLTKKMKKLRKKKRVFEKIPKIGEEIVTEALVVYSTATVVWQDGTIEHDIPSTQLYPIHHLDEHEFFPGDFVLNGSEGPEVSHRDYGVIQNVDHQGRTALVKWFRTYTCADEPKPALLCESEVSVYDLKDHPDFQYRPGTIVIRVANFIGDDASCTAGQVIDNYPEGKVKVWWVDDHISMCWPQDLFEVGQYDADNNFFSNGDSDNDSWETESEMSEPGGTPPKVIAKLHLSSNLERARIAMARLEEIFSMNPNLQNQEVMRKLLGVYKKCRYLDRLMNTSFFHERHFLGLLERVRKGGNATTAERVQDQMNRLFNPTSPSTLNSSFSGFDIVAEEANTSLNDSATKPTAQQFSTPHKYPKPSSVLNTQNLDEKNNLDSSFNKDLVNNSKISLNFSPKRNSSIGDNSLNSEYQTPNKLLHCLINNIDKATKETAELHRNDTSKAQPNINVQTLAESSLIDDSGIFSKIDRDEDVACGGCSNESVLNEFRMPTRTKFDEDLKSISCCSFELVDEAQEFVCAKLCALIKVQLVKALQDINQRFCQCSSSLSVIVVEEFDANEEVVTNSVNAANPDVNLMDTSVDEIECLSNTSVIARVPLECFVILESAPNTHKYHLTIFEPTNTQQFYKAIRREHKLLKNSLPSGVWVRIFEDRMDLLSVMIEGPRNTPYEDGMFLFDIQLGQDYPRTPPHCHFISYCADRLNPNLYEDGKVCVSLLGTWSGRGSEIWGPNSTLLQVIVSIQGLILVAEPYFNEAGYEKQKGTQQGKENSRMYNEMVVLKLVQSMSKLITSPPEIFREEILRHFNECGKSMHDRIKGWMDLSNEQHNLKLSSANNGVGGTTITTAESSAHKKLTNTNTAIKIPPDFPLVPASRGFCLTLVGLLENFYKKVELIEN